MVCTRADILTIIFDHGRRQRRRTYTNVHYALTWNSLSVALPGDGPDHEYDRWDITHTSATVNHSSKGMDIRV